MVGSTRAKIEDYRRVHPFGTNKAHHRHGKLAGAYNGLLAYYVLPYEIKL